MISQCETIETLKKQYNGSYKFSIITFKYLAILIEM